MSDDQHDVFSLRRLNGLSLPSGNATHCKCTGCHLWATYYQQAGPHGLQDLTPDTA
ncbi:hypothetical protein JS672_004413 [Escherichia coli]|nr:hypothetical protein [Escherichia coli]EHC4982474.1 hypothetical protein [Escherichia coli]HAH9222727.1 hypothetical protein [Escherichia coli]